MSKEKETETLDDLLIRVRSYITDKKELENIEKAYRFAEVKHKGQFRKSGEEYIIHPLNVAIILTSIYADSETIQAALLHDVLEDTDCTEDEMRDIFGSEVTKLVQGVTKLSKIHFSTENDYLIDYYKKIIVGISEDVRVIIVKLADRLHNMRTLWALPEVKQKKIAKEALRILAPIGDHLGIHKIKSELEDLSLRYLKPDVFYDIAEKLNNTKLERDKTVYEMLQEVTSLLTEHNIVHEIKGRSKSIYSIYNKLNKGKKFSDIYDLLGLRILVHTEQECYLALGIIHSKFRPLPRRFKDYIAMPKPNMYQSLHTTVFGLDGYLFEIQIRTYDMDEVAENGIASHWAYKENKDAKATMQSTTEQKLQFFKSIMDLKNDKMSSEEFVHSVTDEVLNNNIVPLNYELKSNDIVKINTNKNSSPSKEWINIVKATQTKNKIKSYFSKNERELYIERGKYNLEKELRKRKLSFNEFFSEENIKKICDSLKTNSLEEIYLVVGNGKNSPNSVINIIDKYKEVPVPKIVKMAPKQLDTDIIVSGIDKVKVNLANCCNPIYGDEIVGYITKGNGISVHRRNCHNISMLENRTVPVNWNDTLNQDKKYLTLLVLYSNTSENKMPDIVQKISILNINIDSVKTISKTDEMVYELGVYVRGLEQLNRLLLELDKQQYIYRVERLMR